MDDQNPFKSIVTRYGLILGGSMVGAFMVFYAMSYQWLVSYTLFGIVVILGLLIPILGGVAHRKALGGHIAFGEAWKSQFVIYVIGTLMSSLVSVVIYEVVDPNLGEKLTDEIITKTLNTMDSFGTPEEVIEETMKAFEDQREDMIGQFTALGTLIQLLKGWAFAAVILLIPAAIIKRKKPEEALDSE